METLKKKRNWLYPEKPAHGRWGRWILARLAVLVITFLVIAVGGGLMFTDRLIFHPSANVIDAPERYGLTVEDPRLTLPGGQQLRAWFIPAAPDAAGKKIALVLQGNSGNISMMSSRLSFWHILGFAALTVDYPGYGPNAGSPSEENTYQSAEAAWLWAAAHGYRPEDIVIHGYSLGGGVASQLAERHPPAALVLDSTFTRLRDVPSRSLPWLAPYFRLILGEAFDTQGRLARIRCPLLILHSPKDEVVPYPLGEELFRSYQNNYKDMATGVGGHTDFLLNSPLYMERARALLKAAGLR